MCFIAASGAQTFCAAPWSQPACQRAWPGVCQRCALVGWGSGMAQLLAHMPVLPSASLAEPCFAVTGCSPGRLLPGAVGPARDRCDLALAPGRAGRAGGRTLLNPRLSGHRGADGFHGCAPTRRVPGSICNRGSIGQSGVVSVSGFAGASFRFSRGHKHGVRWTHHRRHDVGAGVVGLDGSAGGLNQRSVMHPRGRGAQLQPQEVPQSLLPALPVQTGERARCFPYGCG